MMFRILKKNMLFQKQVDEGKTCEFSRYAIYDESKNSAIYSLSSEDDFVQATSNNYIE